MNYVCMFLINRWRRSGGATRPSTRRSKVSLTSCKRQWPREKAATPQPDPEMEAKINSLEDEVNRQKEVGLCVDICPLIQGKKSTLPGEKSEGWRRFQREKLACAYGSNLIRLIKDEARRWMGAILYYKVLSCSCNFLFFSPNKI